MTFIMIISALDELINMESPQIVSYEYPYSRTERKNIIPLEFEKYKFVIGLEVEVENDETEEKSGGIPIEIGKLVAHSSHKESEPVFFDVVNCTTVLSKETLEASKSKNVDYAVDEGVFCVDPKGPFTTKFDDEVASGDTTFNIDFMSCEDL